MSDIELFSPAPEHLPKLGRICYKAFCQISKRHGFERDFARSAHAVKVLRLLHGLPDTFAVAARLGRHLVGSNFLQLLNRVAGVGPLSVAPAFHGLGIGRRLMLASLDYARHHGIAQLRLLQDTYNITSLSLYASLGFEVREPIALLKCPAFSTYDDSVREARESDLPVLERLCVQHYKTNRRNELAVWFKKGFPLIVREQEGRICGYLMPGHLGHGVADSEPTALAMVSQVHRYVWKNLDFIFCPLRNTSFYRALLKLGCRLTKVMTLMTLGPYEEPEGIWLPSVVY